MQLLTYKEDGQTVYCINTESIASIREIHNENCTSIIVRLNSGHEISMRVSLQRLFNVLYTDTFGPIEIQAEE